MSWCNKCLFGENVCFEEDLLATVTWGFLLCRERHLKLWAVGVEECLPRKCMTDLWLNEGNTVYCHLPLSKSLFFWLCIQSVGGKRAVMLRQRLSRPVWGLWLFYDSRASKKINYLELCFFFVLIRPKGILHSERLYSKFTPILLECQGHILFGSLLWPWNIEAYRPAM